MRHLRHRRQGEYESFTVNHGEVVWVALHWQPPFENRFCLRMSCVHPQNSYRKNKACFFVCKCRPFVSMEQQKTALIYKDKKVPFYRAFRNLFTLYLQHLSSNRTNNRHFLPIRGKILSPSSNSHGKSKSLGFIKKYSSPICKKTSFRPPVLRNDLQFVYKTRPQKQKMHRKVHKKMRVHIAQVPI